MTIIEKTSSQSSFYKLRIRDSSWDYNKADTKLYTQGFHSYPAMMIPQVAKRLIENYSNEGDVILDPFCGSGSVLVESKLTKRYSWGIDLNPLAILIARVKTTPISPANLYEEFNEFFLKIDTIKDESINKPDFFNIDFWFKEAVIRSLSKIKMVIDQIEKQDIRDFFNVAFSETVRLSSNTRSHEFKLYRYAKEKLEEHNPNPILIFREKLLENILKMIDYYKVCPKEYWNKVILADFTKPITKILPNSIDLIVTSPPYGDSKTTVAYGQFSKLSSQWLGLLSYDNVDNNLLGGKTFIEKDNLIKSPSLKVVLDLISKKDEKRAKQVESFYFDLNKSIQNMALYLKTNGNACIIVGNRRVKETQIPTDIIVSEISESVGLYPLKIIVRDIPNKRMPLKNSPTNIKGMLQETMHNEHIVILKKQLL